MDSTGRRNFFSNTNAIIGLTNGKNIILASRGTRELLLRAPYDLINLGILLGLTYGKASDAISNNALMAIKHAGIYLFIRSALNAADFWCCRRKERKRSNSRAIIRIISTLGAFSVKYADWVTRSNNYRVFNVPLPWRTWEVSWGYFGIGSHYAHISILRSRGLHSMNRRTLSFVLTFVLYSHILYIYVKSAQPCRATLEANTALTIESSIIAIVSADCISDPNFNSILKIAEFAPTETSWNVFEWKNAFELLQNNLDSTRITDVIIHVLLQDKHNLVRNMCVFDWNHRRHELWLTCIHYHQKIQSARRVVVWTCSWIWWAFIRSNDSTWQFVWYSLSSISETFLKAVCVVELYRIWSLDSIRNAGQ